MKFSYTSILPVLAQSHWAIAATPRGFLGPAFPAPTDLTSNDSLVHAAWLNVTSMFESSIAKKEVLEDFVTDLGAYTISIGAFSTHDPAAAKVLQYHHTGPDVANATLGVHQVDGDSIYRVASISKLFTVYLTLINLGSRYWETPITDFVTGLNVWSEKAKSDPLDFVDWSLITLGDLAGQMGGVPHEAFPFNTDLAYNLPQLAQIPPTSLGFPPLNTSDYLTPCAALDSTAACAEDQYLIGIGERAPVFAPWETPVYSDSAFGLLGYAIENITGRTLEDMFPDDIFKPLDMCSTFYIPPTNYSHAVIPGETASTAFTVDGGPDRPSGGIFSTTNDLAKFGVSILNSTFISPLDTRRWMKPITHSASEYFSVGRPWEIFQTPYAPFNRSIELYTKAGDAPNVYSSYLILSPDHGVGFSILVGSDNLNTSYANRIIADTITSVMIPALEAQAAQEASLNLAGTYKAPFINSSITLGVDPSLGPGLAITSLISNSSDLFSEMVTLLGFDELNLFPTGLSTTGVNGTKNVAYRGAQGTSTLPSTYGIFLSALTIDGDWEVLDSYEYGMFALDLFILTTDVTGKAISVTIPALRITLDRVA